MTKKEWRKLSIQEIHEFWVRTSQTSLVTGELKRAREAGSTFRLGVDKCQVGYRITINEDIASIFLRPDTERIRQIRDRNLAKRDYDHDRFKDETGVIEPIHVAICPSVEQAGTAEWLAVYSFFYVSPQEFAVFCREAEQIFNEYSLEGYCFRMIPDIWFDDMALIQFMRERLQPHPAMKRWFVTPAVSSRRHWSPIMSDDSDSPFA